jgi:hypothetical protein
VFLPPKVQEERGIFPAGIIVCPVDRERKRKAKDRAESTVYHQTSAEEPMPKSTWSASKTAQVTFAVVAGASLLVGAIWLLQSATGNFDKFGGFFGGVLGPILSGLAFVALVYTIKLQTEQISIARDELAEAKVERQQAQEQAKIATFFEMVQLHHLIVSGIKIGAEEGRAALSYMATSELTADYAFSAGQEGARSEC